MRESPPTVPISIPTCERPCVRSPLWNDEGRTQICRAGVKPITIAGSVRDRIHKRLMLKRSASPPQAFLQPVPRLQPPVICLRGEITEGFVAAAQTET